MTSVPNNIDWQYVAGIFEVSGCVYEKKIGTGLGLEARLRFSSYDKVFLEKLRRLTGGSISSERHPKGPYYRLTITGYFRVHGVLMKMMPYLQRRREEMERWLMLHKAILEIHRLQSRLHLPRGRYLSRQVRKLSRQVKQLHPPSITDPSTVE